MFIKRQAIELREDNILPYIVKIEYRCRGGYQPPALFFNFYKFCSITDTSYKALFLNRHYHNICPYSRSEHLTRRRRISLKKMPTNYSKYCLYIGSDFNEIIASFSVPKKEYAKELSFGSHQPGLIFSI